MDQLYILGQHALVSTQRFWQNVTLGQLPCYDSPLMQHPLFANRNILYGYAKLHASISSLIHLKL